MLGGRFGDTLGNMVGNTLSNVVGDIFGHTQGGLIGGIRGGLIRGIGGRGRGEDTEGSKVIAPAWMPARQSTICNYLEPGENEKADLNKLKDIHLISTVNRFLRDPNVQRC